MAIGDRTWLEEASDSGYVPGATSGRDEKGFVVYAVSQPKAGIMRRFAPGGIGVNMFWARPGEYFDDMGRVMPDQLAEMAGYDIKRLGQEKAKLDAMGVAQREIEAQFYSSAERKVVLERDGYLLVDIGIGRFNIEFGADGTLMNAQGPLSEDIARVVFDKLAPKPPKVAKV